MHNQDGEPILLQGALVVVWDTLEEPLTIERISARLGASDGADVELAALVRQSVESLEAVGLVVESP